MLNIAHIGKIICKLGLLVSAALAQSGYKLRFCIDGIGGGKRETACTPARSGG
jgi:hypothetical protein